ncbi:MAG: hypothetical protein ACI860_001188 [Chitinophagales bacterium]|jgi:hypothetical protein
MAAKDIVIVQQKHLQAGIEKYQAKIDTHLQSIITNAGYEYKVYRFADGRILLVLPLEISGVLYLNDEVLYAKLQLD